MASIEQLYAQAVADHRAGRMAQAEQGYLAVLEQAPTHLEALHKLGLLRFAAGRLEPAREVIERAIAVAPRQPVCLFLRAAIAQQQGRIADALAGYELVLELQPDNLDARGNLGGLLHMSGRLDEAIGQYRQVVERQPLHAHTLNNLGCALRDIGRLDEALGFLERACVAAPAMAAARSNLGATQLALGRYALAEHELRHALTLQPDLLDAHVNLSSALIRRGDAGAAVALLRRALETHRHSRDVYDNLLQGLNYAPDESAEAIFAAHRDYDARYCAPLRADWRPHGNARDAGRRLKVGYVSPDFRRHSVRHFLEPLLAHHDHAAFEVFAYADLAQEDEVTQRYKGHVDHWCATTRMSDAELAERIRADGIDILVDLAGHTARNRLGVFARKPAPVSLSWLGYGYTTGLSAIDYFLTDEVTVPAGQEALFSEEPWRLESPAYAYRPAEGMGEVGELPALERGHVSFGTLTRAVRINEHTLRAWSEILRRVPGAKLIVDSRDYREAAMQDELRARFAAHGIGAERLELGYHSPPWDVLRRMDIGLDCFPHNSGTTLSESLYMGVPFITLAGRPSVGRLGSTVLTGAGHPEWIAASEDEYVERAVALAGDLPALARVRASLRGDLQRSALMNEAGFARKVETALRAMFARWCDGGSAAPPEGKR